MFSKLNLALCAFLVSAALVASQDITTQEEDCPAEQHLTKRYHVYNTTATFFQAWRLCHDAGQRLATITSCQDSARIQEAVASSSNPKGPWFIGGIDEGKKPSFMWIATNEPIGSYQNFYKEQPDNNNGNEGCLEIGRWGGVQWNDIPCGRLQKFICEDFVMM